jgi:tRNA(Arg) A34 adenosine deaminase TadA
MDFYLSAWEIAKRAPLLVAPENRAKYRNQVQAGFGLYLDMYTNDEKSYWYFGPINGSRLNHLRTNFHQASSASDQYCWVYGEKFRWIKWDWNLKDRDAPTWEEQLPGFARTLALITDPIEGSRRILDEGLAEGTLVNLVSNPDCSPLKQGELKHAAADWTAGNLPEGWSFWRRDEKEGDFGLDTSKGFGDSYSARATGVDDGCFIVRIPVVPGNAYLVECYTVGEGNPNLRARWQKEGKWVVPNKDVMISYDKRVNTSQWRRAVGVVDVPPEADSLILLMATRLAPNQTAWFDKPGIYLLQEQVEHLSERTTKNMESQEVFMKQAIELASEGVLQNYGGPFGAIVVKDGKIVGRGHNRVTSTNDPTAHAEVMAIRDACKNLNTFLLTDCDLYTSCEPCPMCFGAIYWAHIKRVYFSATRDTASDFGFDDGLIYREVALPSENRRVQFIPLLPEQGVGPFQIWNKKQNKIEY